MVLGGAVFRMVRRRQPRHDPPGVLPPVPNAKVLDVLYDGPPFDIEIVYEAPTAETLSEETLALG